MFAKSLTYKVEHQKGSGHALTHQLCQMLHLIFPFCEEYTIMHKIR